MDCNGSEDAAHVGVGAGLSLDVFQSAYFQSA